MNKKISIDEFYNLTQEQMYDYIYERLHLDRYNMINTKDLANKEGYKLRIIGFVSQKGNRKPYLYSVYPVDLAGSLNFDPEALFKDYHEGFCFKPLLDNKKELYKACEKVVDFGIDKRGMYMVAADIILPESNGQAIGVTNIRKLDHDESSLRTKMEEINEFENQKVSLKGDIDKLSGKIEDAKAKHREAEGVLENIEKEIAGAQERYDNLKECAVYLNGKIERFVKNLESLGYTPDLKKFGIEPIIEPFEPPEDAYDIIEKIEDMYSLSEKIAEQLKNRPDKPLLYDVDTIRAFLSAMLTGQLIILSGPPGTGKSSLPPAIAKCIRAEFHMVSVQPSWTDNQDLLGFYDAAHERFVPTPFLNILHEASKNTDKIYIVCLDEMNLVRVEYYFSEILSAMETEDKTLCLYGGTAIKPNAVAAELLDDQNPAAGQRVKESAAHLNDYPSNFTIPGNVQFVGTLNMDETTRELSPKVLDRSFIIEIGRREFTDFDTLFAPAQNAGGYDNGEAGRRPRYTPKAFENVTPLDDVDDETAKGVIKALYNTLKEIGALCGDGDSNSSPISARSLRHIKALLMRGARHDSILYGKILPSLRCGGINEGDMDNIIEKFDEYIEKLKEITRKQSISIDGTRRKLSRMYDKEMGELNFWR